MSSRSRRRPLFYKITGISDLPVRILSNPYRYWVHYDLSGNSSSGHLPLSRKLKRFVHSVDGYCEGCRFGDPIEKYYLILYSYKDQDTRVLDSSIYFVGKIKKQIQQAKKRFPDAQVEDFLFDLSRVTKSSQGKYPWTYEVAFSKYQLCSTDIQKSLDNFLNDFSVEKLCYPSEEELDYLDDEVARRIADKSW